MSSSLRDSSFLGSSRKPSTRSNPMALGEVCVRRGESYMDVSDVSMKSWQLWYRLFMVPFSNIKLYVKSMYVIGFWIHNVLMNRSLRNSDPQVM